MAAHCIQPTDHNSAVNIVDAQSEKRKKKRKKKKEPSYTVHGEVIWNDNIWDDNELTYYRRLHEFWSTLCIGDRIAIATLEKDLVILKMKEQQRITCNCDCCTQERREFEVDVEECFAIYHDELIRMDMRNDYGDKLSQMPLEECTLNEAEFVFYWSLSSDGHQISVSPELVEGGALFIDLLESSQYDDMDEDFYDQNFEDIQAATDDLEEVQLAWGRLLVGRKFFQTFIARMFEERLLVAYREKLAFDKQQKLIAEEEEEERLRKERDENRQLARQRKRDRKKEQKKAAADRKKQEEEESFKAEQRKQEQELMLKIEEEKKRKDKRRHTKPSKNEDNDEASSNSSGSRSSSIERVLLENVPEQAKLSECLKKSNVPNGPEKKHSDPPKPVAKLKKENKPPVTPQVNTKPMAPIAPPKTVIDELKMSGEDTKKSKKRRRKQNKKKQDVDTSILANNTNIPGSSSIFSGASAKKDEPQKTSRKAVVEAPLSKNITIGTSRVSPPNITSAALSNNQSPESPRLAPAKREQPSVPKQMKVSPKNPAKSLYEKPIQIPIPPLKPAVAKSVVPKNITIKKTQAHVITTTTLVASTAAPGYERSINSVSMSTITMTTTQAMSIINSHTSTSASVIGSTTQSVWGATSPISSIMTETSARTTPIKPPPKIPDAGEVVEGLRVPTPKAIGSERAADRAIGSERAKNMHKETPMNGLDAGCSPFANSNPGFFLGLQEILSSAKPTEKSPSELFFEDDLTSSFPGSWTASTGQGSLWSSGGATVPAPLSTLNSVSVTNSLDSSNSSRSSPEVNSLWMQHPPPSQTPPWSCVGPKVPLTPPPTQQQQAAAAGSSMPIPGIIHIPRSISLQSNPSLSPFQAFSGLDQRGVRQWTPRLHSGFEMPPMRPS